MMNPDKDFYWQSKKNLPSIVSRLMLYKITNNQRKLHSVRYLVTVAISALYVRD